MLAYLGVPPREPVFSRWALLIATVSASVQFGLVMPPALGTDAGPHERPMTAAEYLLPLWPSAGQGKRSGSERVQWARTDRANGSGPAGSWPGAGPRRARKTGRPHRAATPPAGPQPEPAIPTTYDGSRVYVEPELQHPVARDPSSDAPAYPDSLRSKGIEGLVVIRFIVDTAGRADSTTLRIVETTHPGFAQAVRVALPRMKFIPAQLDGRRVPVLVMQEFRFVIQRADTARALARGRT